MDIETRVTDLEQWRYRIDIARAKEEVDRKHIDGRFDDIEDALGEIKTTAKWLNRTVWAAIIAYLVKFILDGGLSTLPGVTH